MENMFLSAMDTQELDTYNEIKLNKEFGLRMIDDLKKLYYLYEKIEHNANNVIVQTKSRESYNYYSAFIFNFNADGISFTAKHLLYPTYKNSSITRLKDLPSPLSLYEKYKDNPNSSAEARFLDGDMGNVTIQIKFKRNAKNITEILRDIMTQLTYSDYNRKF